MTRITLYTELQSSLSLYFNCRNLYLVLRPDCTVSNPILKTEVENFLTRKYSSLLPRQFLKYSFEVLLFFLKCK